MPLPRLLIVGGGPIGLEMAVAAVRSTKWQVTIAERGNELCSNVVSWEHVRLFSPWKMNTTEAGRAVARAVIDEDADCEYNYPTGREFLDRYLRPVGEYLAESERCSVLLGTDVISIGKSTDLLKGDRSSRRRKVAPFRTLVTHQHQRSSEEKILISDAVVDASGTYGNGNWLGIGGVPALGERTVTSAATGNIRRTIPNVEQDAARYLNRTTAVIGSGYSAITTINNLRHLALANPDATLDVHWCTRRGNGEHGSGTALYESIDNDPLPQRETLSNLANALTSSNEDITGPTNNFRLRYHPLVQLESISISRTAADSDSDSGSADGTLNLVLQNVNDVAGHADDNGHDIPCTRIEGIRTVIASVGYRPDNSIFQELRVHQCYATEGPMRLAAALMSSAGAGSADCLAQEAPGKETMRNPEPQFYIIGMKSYGRSSKFLLSVGHEQVRHVLELLDEGTMQVEGG